MAKNRVVSGQRSEVGEQRSENREQRSVEGEGSFAERQAEAESKRGIVAPNLADAVVEVVNVPKHDFTGTGKEALRKAEKWAKENLVGIHTATNMLGEQFEYNISNDAIGKYLSRSATNKSDNIGVHLAVLKQLPKVISASIDAEVHPDYVKGETGTRGEIGINKSSLVHRLYGAVEIDGKTYRVKTTIREYADKSFKNLAHSYEVTKIELIEAASDNPNIGTTEHLPMTSNNSISATNLLQGVEKSYDSGKKLLDESENKASFSITSSNQRDKQRAVNKAIDDINAKRDLVAVHNLSEQNLLQALELGGFPMPSIAITKSKMGHSKFGEISLVFGKETIDPSNKRNKVYGHDAWTPRFPQIGYKINAKAVSTLREKIEGLLGHEVSDEYNVNGNLVPTNVEDMIERNGNAVSYAYEPYMKLAYLRDNGVNVEIPVKSVDYGSTSDAVLDIAKKHNVSVLDMLNGSIEFYRNHPEIVAELLEVKNADNLKDFEKYKGTEKYDRFVALITERELPFNRYSRMLQKALQLERDLASGGRKQQIDTDSLNEKLNAAVDSTDAEFVEWLNNQFADVIEKRGIRNKKDAFTPSGNRREWESLYDEITLDNVVKAMLSQNAQGGNTFFDSSFQGAAAERYGSIEQIRKRANERMRRIDPEAYTEGAADIIHRFNGIVDEVTKRDKKMSFDMQLNARQYFIEAVGKKKDAKGIYNELHQWYPTLTMEDCKEIAALVKEIQGAATEFFEAKPQRAVGFDEVKLAVVPQDRPDLADALSKRGIRVETYERGNEQERINLVDWTTRQMDIRFMFIGEDGAGRLDRTSEARIRMDNLAKAKEWEKSFGELEGNPKEAKRLQEAAKSVRELSAIKSENYPTTRVDAEKAYKAIGSAKNKQTGVEVTFFGSAFNKNHREGGLFEKAIPALKDAFEKSVFAFSEKDNLSGKVRKDGTIHKEHRSIRSFDNYVGKVDIEGKEYYIRYIVQMQPGQNGVHSQMVTNVELYDTKNPVSVASYRDSSLPARLDTNRIVDAKLQRFFALASGNAHEFAKAVKFATGWERVFDSFS